VDLLRDEVVGSGRYALYSVLYRESNINRKVAFSSTKTQVFFCLVESWGEFKTYRADEVRVVHGSNLDARRCLEWSPRSPNYVDGMDNVSLDTHSDGHDADCHQ
jgi:hypothetical protein